MGFTPSVGDELQSENFIPRRHAADALRALKELAPHFAPVLLVSEIRTIAADTLWLSPAYRQDCVGIHFTWNQDWMAVRTLLPVIEAKLAPFDPRAHWGKLSTLPPDAIRNSYKRLPDFRDLARRLDPGGKFANDFLRYAVLDTA